MSIWKRFKNWLIIKLGGYTEEKTKIVEKIVEKPIDEIQITYYRAEPICISSRVAISRYEIKDFLDNKGLYEALKSKISHQIAKQITDNDGLLYSITYDPMTDKAIIEVETNIVLSNPSEHKPRLEELLSMYAR